VIVTSYLLYRHGLLRQSWGGRGDPAFFIYEESLSMMAPARDTTFKPKLSQTESKAEAVSRIAKSLIKKEAALREAKTARLREARLAKEAVEISASKPPRARPKR
jgi:hypothetical protein